LLEACLNLLGKSFLVMTKTNEEAQQLPSPCHIEVGGLYVSNDDDEKKESYDEEQLTDSILSKWQNQDRFIRILDGNTNNCSIYNLCQVSLDDAMDHIDEWKVNWDMDLTRREIALVKDPVWRAGLSQPNKYISRLVKTTKSGV
jgi:hypothetical protein